MTQTPLLIVTDARAIELQISVLADLTRGFSATGPLGGARIVFGIGGTEEVLASVAERREVANHHRDALREKLQIVTGSMPPHRFGAGREIYRLGPETPLRRDRAGAPIERPLESTSEIERVIGQRERLWWALPGRATQAHATAGQVVDAMFGRARPRTGPRPATALPPWNLDQLAMYFSSAYDNHHE